MAAIQKPPLSHEELRHIIDLSLWAGQLLLQHGAESERVEETVHRLGTGLGCDWMDILVSTDGLLITANSNGEFRTKTRRVVRIVVNMSTLVEVNSLSHRVVHGELTRYEVEKELRRITDAHHHYNRWTVVLMVGCGCAAFSRLFGADLSVVAVTFFASAIAMFVRQEMTKRYFNIMINVIITAFVAGLVASSATLLNIGERPQLALAASVLLLVPGVPLINAAEDLIKGYTMTGLARGFFGALIALCIALGLLLAMALTGVSGL